MDQNEMSNLYRGPSIDASYQVSVHLAEGFQRRRLKCEKLTDDRRRTSNDGKSSHCLWQGQLKNNRQMFRKICTKSYIFSIVICNLWQNLSTFNTVSIFQLSTLSVFGRIRCRICNRLVLTTLLKWLYRMVYIKVSYDHGHDSPQWYDITVTFL